MPISFISEMYFISPAAVLTTTLSSQSGQLHSPRPPSHHLLPRGRLVQTGEDQSWGQTKQDVNFNFAAKETRGMLNLPKFGTPHL